MPGLTADGLDLVTVPAVELVTLDQAKKFCRIESKDEDPLVTDLVAAARRRCEMRMRQAYITQVWDQYCDGFPAGGCGLELKRSPVQSVTSITYYPAAGGSATVSAADYYLEAFRTRGARIHLNIDKAWPSAVLRVTDGVVVRFSAGFGAAPEQVPEHVRLAIKQLVAFWYQNREATEQIPAAIDELLTQSSSSFAFA